MAPALSCPESHLVRPKASLVLWDEFGACWSQWGNLQPAPDGSHMGPGLATTGGCLQLNHLLLSMLDRYRKDQGCFILPHTVDEKHYGVHGSGYRLSSQSLIMFTEICVTARCTLRSLPCSRCCPKAMPGAVVCTKSPPKYK